MKSIQKPIVIVGAGFAGMTFALNLKNLNPSLPILVVDSETNFIFKPLMYEVLSKEIRSWEATPKFANIFSDAGITFLRNCLTKISFKENILEFSDDLKLSYQYLVICTGSIPNSFSIKGVRKGKDLGHQNVTAVSQRMTAVLVNLIDLKAAIIQANPDVKRAGSLRVKAGSEESQKQFQQAGIKTIKDLEKLISKVSKLIGIFEVLQSMPQQKLSKQKYGPKNLQALTKEFKENKKKLGDGFTLKATKKKNIDVYRGTDKMIELKMESPEYNRDYKAAAENSIAVEFRKILRNRDENTSKVKKLFKTIKHEDIEGSPSIKQKIRGDLKKLAKGKKVSPHRSTKTSKTVKVKSKARINLAAISQTPAITKKLAKEAGRLKAATNRGKATKAGAPKILFVEH